MGGTKYLCSLSLTADGACSISVMLGLVAPTFCSNLELWIRRLIEEEEKEEWQIATVPTTSRRVRTVQLSSVHCTDSDTHPLVLRRSSGAKEGMYPINALSAAINGGDGPVLTGGETSGAATKHCKAGLVQRGIQPSQRPKPTPQANPATNKPEAEGQREIQYRLTVLLYQSISLSISQSISQQASPTDNQFPPAPCWYGVQHHPQPMGNQLVRFG